MTIANISQASPTAALNVDINGVSIQGNALVSTGDDAFRATLAMIAKFYDDYGGTATVAGTADAITLTTTTSYGALATGMRLSFIAGANNTGAVTLNLDAIGAKAVRKISGGTDVALVASDILQGAMCDIIYNAAANAAAGAWILTAVQRLTFPSTITPNADDGAALGTTALKWSDLFLADGSVINWNNGDLTATHGSNLLAFQGGNFVFGDSASRSTQATANVQVATTFALIRYNATPSTAGQLAIAKSASGSQGTHTIVADGERLGNLQFEGSDGTNFIRAADIFAEVDGTPGTNDMPGRLGFRTTSDGGTTPAERWRISSTGFLSAQSGSIGRGAPVTKTGDFTVGAAENWIISNRGATNTATLPSAATYPGRELMFSTIQAQTVVSNASNVVPRAGGAAGTAILPATDGAWATLVSDGTNWIIMASS